MASRKLRHYFQECSITVASEVPLNDIINNRDATGRIAKWAIELLPFDITYKPRRAIKSQVLAVIAPWTEPFPAYLTRQELPEDQNEARCIVRQSKAYKVHEGELYKKSTTGVLQRCISEEEGRKLLAEIHAGLGGHHAAARALVSKAFRTGFYWPTARVDAQ